MSHPQSFLPSHSCYIDHMAHCIIGSYVLGLSRALSESVIRENIPTPIQPPINGFITKLTVWSNNYITTNSDDNDQQIQTSVFVHSISVQTFHYER